VVLEFGSYTCPIFSDRIPAMEQLAREHPQATFLVIYVREAHPGEIQGAHRNLADKRAAAHKLAMEEALSRRVLVDSTDGATHRTYGGAWNPVYVVDAAGRVVMRQAWNHPAEVAQALRALESGTEPHIAEIHRHVARTGWATVGPATARAGWSEGTPGLLCNSGCTTSRRLAQFAFGGGPGGNCPLYAGKAQGNRFSRAIRASSASGLLTDHRSESTRSSTSRSVQN
jgi:iodothyronine deiodinase-like protein